MATSSTVLDAAAFIVQVRITVADLEDVVVAWATSCGPAMLAAAVYAS